VAALTYDFFVDVDDDLSIFDAAALSAAGLSASSSGEDFSLYLTRFDMRCGLADASEFVGEPPALHGYLDNSGGQFLPETTSTLAVGRWVRLRAMEGASTYTLFIGLLESFKVVGQGSEVEFWAYGSWRYVRYLPARLPLLVNVTAPQVLVAALTFDLFRAALRRSLSVSESNYLFLSITGYCELDTARLVDAGTVLPVTNSLGSATGVVTFPYVGDQFDSGGHLAALAEQVTTAEGGVLVEQGGVYQFYRRDQAAYAVDSGVVLDGADCVDVDYRFGDLLVNYVEVIVRPRQVGTSVAVFTLVEPVALPALSNVTRRFHYRDAAGDIQGALSPLVGSVAVFPNSDGSGASALASVTWFPVYLGNAVEVTFTNYGAVTLYVTALVVTATELLRLEEIAVVGENHLSESFYGRRAERINLPLLGNGQAQAVADYRASRFCLPQGRVASVTVNPAALATTPACLFGVSMIAFRMTLPLLGHEGLYLAVGSGCAWDGHETRLTTYLRPVASGYFRFDVAGFDELDTGRYLIY